MVAGSLLSVSRNEFANFHCFSLLQGLPLTSLNVGGCKKVTHKDLEHLRGLPLASLKLSECNLKGKKEALQSLEGMPLTELDLVKAKESVGVSLAPLR